MLSLAIHFEALGQSLCLTLNHTLASQDHIVLYLMGEHINFTRGLIVSLKDVLVALVFDLSLHGHLHDVLKRLQFVALHSLKFHASLVVLSCCKLPLSLDFIHLSHDFPAESLIEFQSEGLHVILHHG